MKKFYLFIFVFVVSLFIPKSVFASNLTDDEKIAIALYQEAVREGYTIDVPEALRGNSFYNAMQPLVNIIKGSVQSVNDVFEFVGDTLVYDVNKVKGWLSGLFGSDRDGVVDNNNVSVPTNYDVAISEAYQRGYISSNVYSFLSKNKYFFKVGNTVYFWGPTSFDTFKFIDVSFYYSFSNSVYTFSYRTSYASFFSETSSSNVFRYYNLNNPLSIGNGNMYVNSISFTSSNSDFDLAVADFLLYLKSFTNMPVRVSLNNNYYYINTSGQQFSLTYQGNPSTDIDITQSAIQETYFTNNTYNEVTNIYNSTTINNINNGGDTDIDIDIDIPFDIDINGSIGSLTSLPGIFENVSSGDLSLISNDSESKEVFSGIFSGLPIEITTLFVTVFILLVVVGVINRLLG